MWPFRKRSDATLERIDRLVQLLGEQASGAPDEPVMRLERRVEELERSRSLWEAEVEGLIAKAIQERKHARNAEERTRHLAKKIGRDESVDGDEESQLELPPEYLAAIQGRDANGGASEGLPAMHQGLGSGRKDRKAAARSFKFGG